MLAPVLQKISMIKIAGKKALVTGGSSGTGLAKAGLFIAQGAQVDLTGLDQIMLAEET